MLGILSICSVIFSRPSETDSLASGGTIKSSIAWSGSPPAGFFVASPARATISGGSPSV